MTTPSFDDTDVAPTNDVAATRPYDELNVSSDAFWDLDTEERDLTFKQLREQRPVSWQRPIESALHPDPNDQGFWALVRHADIVEVKVAARTKIHQIAQQLMAQGRDHPADDLLTNLVQAEVDGEKLMDPEISAVMVLFAVAATDTTRHTASFAVKALTDFRDQR